MLYRPIIDRETDHSDDGQTVDFPGFLISYFYSTVVIVIPAIQVLETSFLNR